MAAGFNIHRKQEFYFCEKEIRFTSSPDAHRSQLSFKFSLQSRTSDWLVIPTQRRLSGTTNQPSIETYVLVNPDDQFLSCPEKARETIGKELQSWPVEPGRLRQLIDAALNRAREMMVECVPPNHSNCVHLHFRAAAFNFRIFSAIEEDNRVRMVPAVESSIESLEKKKIMDCGTNCSICLEEVMRGGEGMLMPCLHVFHEDCIKKWLRTSHYCPVCRFEMPKTSSI